MKIVDDESVPDSWVELAPPSRGSLASSVDAALMYDAQQEAQPSTKKNSPKSLASPNVEFSPNLDEVKIKLASDMLPPGQNTDWIWDWSSRPEIVPPKQYQLARSNVSAVGSTLTTPPNSPAPGDRRVSEGSFGSRHSKLMRTYLFRVDVILGIVVSNLVHFLLGACIGWFLCKRTHDRQLPGL